MLTCLIGRHLGSGIGSLDHFDLRDLAASLLRHLCDKYSKYSHNLKPRLARSCLKHFLDPKKPYGTHYGAILGLQAVGGAEVVRALILPNLREYDELVRDDYLQEEGSSVKKAEAEKVVAALMNVLGSLVDVDDRDALPATLVNGHGAAMADDNDNDDGDDDRLNRDSERQLRARLTDKIGQVMGTRVADSGYKPLIKAILE